MPLNLKEDLMFSLVIKKTVTQLFLQGLLSPKNFTLPETALPDQTIRPGTLSVCQRVCGALSDAVLISISLLLSINSCFSIGIDFLFPKFQPV